MTFAELLAASRTCRRFKGSFTLTEGILADLVDMTRFAPSARNQQPLRYVLISGTEARERMLGLVTLGGGLKPEQRANEDQYPGGYIVILAPQDLGRFGMMDIGIAAQTINLAANSAGLACCIIGAINKQGVAELVGAADGMEPCLVIALGSPDEDRQVCPLGPDGKTDYFRDDNDAHWVPKRDLEELIIGRL